MTQQKVLHRILSKSLMTTLLAFSFINVAAQAPTGYYNAAQNKAGASLKAALHEIIDDHTRFPYTSSSKTDVWDILAHADEDPDNAGNVLTIYKNASRSKSDHNTWNREHSWPKSYGFKVDGSCNYAYTDAHHLFAADPTYNSTRSNLPFGSCISSCSQLPVDNSSYANYASGSGSTGSFQVWNDVRGDLARAMFYMAVRYEGGSHSATGCDEPDLILTNDRNLIISQKSNQSVAHMGMLEVLLAWHEQDPVDDFEKARMEIIYTYQGNRNPFVDHPEWVASIWGTSTGGDNGGGSNGGGGSNTGDSVAWINELHYDNYGTDTGEGVEIAGTAGLNLSGWQLIAYNGNGGGSYLTKTLSGTIENQYNGYGTIWFNMSGLQNGGSDGIALIDNSGNVVQFLSYEGTLTATNGPASGVTSTNIGVIESSSTTAGQSLQLSGEGSNYSDFTWQANVSKSYGVVNGDQTFSGLNSVNTSPWINELHYDNSSTDLNEGVEIAGPAGLNLNGWQIQAYNGGDGRVYKTITLSGSLPNTQNGIGQLWFDVSGLQNGGSDGIALVDANGSLVQFLSYEGTLTAANGGAAGQTSVNIGVSENSNTSSSYSLQLTGSGTKYDDFQWSSPRSHSRDNQNNNQSYQ